MLLHPDLAMLLLRVESTYLHLRYSEQDVAVLLKLTSQVYVVSLGHYIDLVLLMDSFLIFQVDMFS